MSVFIIAEIGQAHDGSLGIAHSYIDALAETGVDAVKFQTHIADAESSVYEPFRVKFSYQDKTRFDYWKRMEFSFSQWKGLKSHCEKLGLEFISSPFSNAAVSLLEKLGVIRYKIGSGEVNNLLMLEKIAKTGKPIILSSGMSSFDELDKSISFLQSFGNHLALLQCTTAYPTMPGEWGVNLIPELRSRYKIPIGFSDHSGKIHPNIAAAVLGAEILEFHVVFDKKMFGPDSKASLTIDEVKQLVQAVRELELDKSLFKTKEINNDINKVKLIFEKSLAVNKDTKVGDVLHFNDLEAKKPSGHGIPANKYKSFLGKKLKRNLNKWDFLKEDDLI